MQEILRRRQEAGFAGRKAQVALFRENLLVPVEDERRWFLFSVHGDGGIGKTFLLRRISERLDRPIATVFSIQASEGDSAAASH